MSDPAGARVQVDVEDVYRHLQAQGLLRSSAAPPPTTQMLEVDDEETRPWFISLLIGAGGWFAGIMLLAAAALVVRPSGAAFFYVIGILLFAAARGLFSESMKGVFSTQLGLSMSLAGQASIMVALFDTLKVSNSTQLVSLVLMLMQVGLVFMMPNYLHRLMSTLFACLAWAVATHFQGEGFVETAMGGRARLTLDAGRMMALGAGAWLLAWVPVLAGTWWMAASENKWVAAGKTELMRPVMLGLLIGGACATYFSSPFAYGGMWFSAGTPGPNWIAMWPLLSMFGAIFMLCVAFRVQSRAGMGFCILAAFAHLGHVYYVLNVSLLTKSVVMLLLGGLCVVLLKFRGDRANGPSVGPPEKVGGV